VRRVVVLLVSLWVVLSTAAMGMAWGAGRSMEEESSAEIEETLIRDPVVCDHDYVSNGIGTAHLTLCGKASQSNPPWLYAINVDAWTTGSCGIYYVSPVPSKAYLYVEVTAYSDCGKLNAMINWVEGH